MATVILNIATELSNEYEIQNIETSLLNTIQTKADLSMKYAQNLNTNGGGFIDIASCPDNFSMSGTTQRTTWITSNLRNEQGIIFCEAIHAWGAVKIYFNSGATDVAFAQFDEREVFLDISQQSAIFSDDDATFIDISNSYPLESDLVDDNFDSDDYRVYSTGTVLYPDVFVDDDIKARLLSYGYVIENSGAFNVLWTNDKIQSYIDENSNNSDGFFTTLWDVNTGYLFLDIDTPHKLILYEVSKNDYNETKELITTDFIEGSDQWASIWYVQSDMTLASGTGSAYSFDFQAHDYALFIENTGTWALLYQITWEDAASGSGIYLNPIKDDDPSVLSFLGNHIFVSADNRLIATQLEVFGLK